jgi:hypothetical protein
MKRSRRMSLLAACLVALAGATSAVAAGVNPFDTTQGSGKKLLLAQSVDSGDQATISDGMPDWTTLLTTQVSIPSTATHALLDASFETSSSCSGGAAGNWCMVRILVDGVEMNPQTGIGSIFDSVPVDANQGSLAAHVLSRSLTVGPGSHTVTVQATPWGDGTSMRVDDYELQLTAYK